MDNLLKDLGAIETEHKEFFENKNLKITQYITISKKPVMIKFNRNLDNVHRLPNEIMEKLEKLIMSYYS